MTRWYLAAVAGLCSVAPLSAQEGTLAPTAPMVPAPVLQNGNLRAPVSGNGGSSSRTFSLTKWSPLRNPATASATEPTALPAAPPAASYANLPPRPPGASVTDGSCGAGGCGKGHHNRSCWNKLKAWLTYHPSPTELPKCVPTPYITPLQGMFPCTAYGGVGCSSGCVAGGGAYPAPPVGQPLDAPKPYTPQPMTQPMTPPSGTAAAPVMMPSRGTQGMIAPTWQGRVTPAPVMADPTISGYRFVTPDATAKPSGIVNTGLKVPAPK